MPYSSMIPPSLVAALTPWALEEGNDDTERGPRRQGERAAALAAWLKIHAGVGPSRRDMLGEVVSVLVVEPLGVGGADEDEVPELIDHLAIAGATMDWLNPEGNTPLLAALLAGAHHHRLKALVDAGADVNAFTPDHQSALHLAMTRTQDVRTAQMLLAEGADVHSLTTEGLRPREVLVHRLRNQTPDWSARQIEAWAALIPALATIEAKSLEDESWVRAIPLPRRPKM